MTHTITTHTPTPEIGQYVKIAGSQADWLINREDAFGNLYAQIPSDVYEIPVTGPGSYRIEAVTSLHHNIPALKKQAEVWKSAAIAKAEGK